MDLPWVTRITLPPDLTEEQRRLLVKYARLPRALAAAEWKEALAAFDVLHQGRVLCGRQRRTFQAFYLRCIEAVHAAPFIEELQAAADIEADGARLAVDRWRLIAASLAVQGVVGDTAEGRALLVYCLYWWRSFSKGYIRELAVFGDLQQSGIAFEAHDLRDPVQRRSAHDLTILGQRGDVKTSTYFIHTARVFPLRCDFYIVRLWNNETNQWRDLVLLKPGAWRALDGEPVPGTWETIAQLLPAPVQVRLRGEALVVVPYGDWKARVLDRQREERSGSL